jgi:hypothetical protein
MHIRDPFQTSSLTVCVARVLNRIVVNLLLTVPESVARRLA